MKWDLFVDFVSYKFIFGLFTKMNDCLFAGQITYVSAFSKFYKQAWYALLRFSSVLVLCLINDVFSHVDIFFFKVLVLISLLWYQVLLWLRLWQRWLVVAGWLSLVVVNFYIVLSIFVFFFSFFIYCCFQSGGGCNILYTQRPTPLRWGCKSPHPQIYILKFLSWWKNFFS